jgi:hypothetical protein
MDPDMGRELRNAKEDYLLLMGTFLRSALIIDARGRQGEPPAHARVHQMAKAKSKWQKAAPVARSAEAIRNAQTALGRNRPPGGILYAIGTP